MLHVAQISHQCQKFSFQEIWNTIAANSIEAKNNQAMMFLLIEFGAVLPEVVNLSYERSPDGKAWSPELLSISGIVVWNGLGLPLHSYHVAYVFFIC